MSNPVVVSLLIASASLWLYASISVPHQPLLAHTALHTLLYGVSAQQGDVTGRGGGLVHALVGGGVQTCRLTQLTARGVNHTLVTRNV